jgi:thymidylate synthase
MRVIEGEDVNELYWRGMNMLRTDGINEDSRNGLVRVVPEPVISVYRKPRQRVLLDMKRAANPFFHLFESLWMLAGRNDVGALNRYITDFGTRFAEKDGTVHGAYGHRWRKAFGFDQLDAIVARLRANPRDRQAVLQMWDARPSHLHQDFGVGCDDLLGDWKDRPCNTQVYFRVRENAPPEMYAAGGAEPEPALDMLITCRSNDIVYGAYGANAVHFSILHEYMAGRIGVKVGAMEQLSFNYHAYHDVLERVGCPAYLETYTGHKLKALPIGTDFDAWDADLHYFMSWQKALVEAGVTEPGKYINRWFSHTVEPMFIAHFKWKNAVHKEARGYAQLIESEDWRFAALQWFEIRTNSRSR